MAGIFKKLSANDIKITPFEAHKQYNTVNLALIGASTASLEWSGKNKSEFSTGSKKYYQLDKLYYRNYIQERAHRLELDDATYTTQERRLYQSASVLSLSQKTFGSEVQPETFELSGSKDNLQFNFKDDGFGNLYDLNKGKDNFPNEDNRLLYLGPTQAFKRANLNVDYETGKTYVNNPFPNGYTRTVYDDSYFLNEIEFNEINFVTSSNSGFHSIRTSTNSSTVKLLPTTRSVNLYDLFVDGDLTVTLESGSIEVGSSGGPIKLFDKISGSGGTTNNFTIDDFSGPQTESFSFVFDPPLPASELVVKTTLRYLEDTSPLSALLLEINNDPSTLSSPSFQADELVFQKHSASFNSFGEEVSSIKFMLSHSALSNVSYEISEVEIDADVAVRNSYIKIPHQPQFNFETSDDFAISFYYDLNRVDHDNSTFDGDYFILTKEGTKYVPILPSEGTQHTSLSASGSAKIGSAPVGPQFPYRIFYKGNYPLTDSASLFFERSDGDKVQFVSASFFSSGSPDTGAKFVSCRSLEGELFLQVDSTFERSTTQNSPTLSKTVSNKANITLYNKPNLDGSFSNFIGHKGGQISQLMMWNGGLTDTEIINVSESITGTPNVGNLFYDNGFAVVTHPKYMDIFDGSVLNTLTYKNTHLITENEYQCTMTEDEFEFTTNNSIRKIPFSDSEDIANFATGSQFKPYVTSVGLYDDDGNLLVVGKLGQPIKASDETDTTFVIRFDT